MRHALILLSLLALTSCTEAQASSYDSPDGKPQNSYETQQETYRQHGYDSYRNGPLQETLEQQRREERRQEEHRRETAEQNRRQPYGDSGGYYGGGSTCSSVYGC